MLAASIRATRHGERSGSGGGGGGGGGEHEGRGVRGGSERPIGGPETGAKGVTKGGSLSSGGKREGETLLLSGKCYRIINIKGRIDRIT